MRNAIRPSGATTVGPYSPAVEAGGFVYLSGQTPIDPATGKLVTGGVAEQTRQCLRNSFNILKAAALTGDDDVKVTVYLVVLSHFPAMNEVYASEFSEPYPARTTVGVRELPLGASVEIEMVARRG